MNIDKITKQAFEEMPVSDDESLFLTLRDRFAMAALTGIISQTDKATSAAQFANQAYIMADAMLAARQKERE